MLFTSALATAKTPLPEPVRAMVERAAASGDTAKTNAVASVARETNPDSKDEIDEIVARHAARRRAEQEARLASIGPLDNWRGSGEVGGSFATGNSNTVTVAVGLRLTRDVLAWRHRVNALADLQRSGGISTQERYALDYQTDWKFSDRGYVWGRLGWERNQVAGLKSRFTEGLGLGYTLVNQPRVRLGLEGGPTLSQTKLLSGEYEGQIAGRLATNFRWDVTPGTRFSEDAFVLVENDNTSVQSTTALTSKLIGKLSARLSFSLQHETNPPTGRESTDTISRATLVYDF